MNRIALLTASNLVLALSVAAACSSTPQAIGQGVISIADGICTIAESQPEPAWVYFVCTVAGAPPSVAKSYTVRVPKDQAAEFQKLHVRTVATVVEGGTQ